MNNGRLKYLLITLFSLAPMLSAAQSAWLLKFEDPVRDLGTVKEVDGTVKLLYRYINVSDKNVVIKDIHTQCGCARPQFDTRPLAPGEAGEVEVIFNPDGKFGDVKVGLTVTATNGDYEKWSTLVVKAHVINRLSAEEIKYPYALSPLIRSDNKAIGMRRLQPGESRVRTMKLYNTTGEQLKLLLIPQSKFLKVKGPKEIPANGEAEIEFTLDATYMQPGEFVIKPVIRAGDEDIIVEVAGLVTGQEEIIRPGS